jgi:hypothetical protein
VFRTEMKAHAQQIYSSLLAAWLSTHREAPSAEQAGVLAEQSLAFARLFSKSVTAGLDSGG